MMHSILVPIIISSLAATASAQSCALQFDGRVPANLGLAGFDAANQLFSNANVLGAGLRFSQLLQLPQAVGGSLVSFYLTFTWYFSATTKPPLAKKKKKMNEQQNSST